MSASAYYTFDDRQTRMVLPHRAPMLLIDCVSRCSPALDQLSALKQISVGDPMLPRGPRDRAFFPPVLVIEALAQCCGLLMSLRWLEARGVDVASFAGGDDTALPATRSPHSVLAETRARQLGLARAGDSLRMEACVTLQRGQMLRFRASAATAAGICTELEVLLAFADYASAARAA